ncbi:MAG: NUDIX domain-containing protein [Clostridiaceae bacterium]|mgnify:CR=1 FL=1|nr:NUDIX domain-containing protein [Clostridiaceae bacterium]
MIVRFYSLGEVSDERLYFAVICTSYKGKWVFVRHKNRDTWEIPGGHREENEGINETASRELFEETGAADYEIEPVCDYSVTIGEKTTFGRLFYAKVIEIGQMPESEIGELRFLETIPDNLTYADIQPQLHRKVLQYLEDRKGNQRYQQKG